MSLPIAWVDRIFERLTVRYGDRFLNRWKGVDMDAVRFDWSNTLTGFEGWPEAIAFAFDHIDDEKPPTASMFRSLALKAPKPERLALPEPAADPERVAAELAKLAPLCRGRAEALPVDPKAWADVILKLDADGIKVNPYRLRCARFARGVPDPEPVYRAHPGASAAARASAPVAATIDSAQAMTPAEAFYAAEQAARSVGGYSSAAMACA